MTPEPRPSRGFIELRNNPGASGIGDFIGFCPSRSSARVYDKDIHTVQPQTYSTPLTRPWLFLILTFLFDLAQNSKVILGSRRASPHIVLRSYNPPLEREFFCAGENIMRNLKFGKGVKNSWFVGQRDLENLTQVLNFCSRPLLNP